MTASRHGQRTAAGRVAPHLAVFAGGSVGGTARYLLGEAFPDPEGGFPATTFAVNVSGAFALALLLVLLVEAVRPRPLLRLALGTGVLGAFTTFSTLVVAADRLVVLDRWPVAAGYVAGSTVAGLAAAATGALAGRALLAGRRTREGR